MMANIVYLDIETIPDKDPDMSDENFLDTLVNGMSTVGITSEFDKYYKREVKRRSLSNLDCRIISISYAINDEPVVNIFNGYHEDLLIQALIDSDLMDIMAMKIVSQVCAYNALAFDLPVIATKLFKYGFKEFVPAIPYLESKYRHTRVFDPMAIFPSTSNERYLTQSRMAEYLGIEDNSDMHGSMVYEAFIDGQHDKIKAYNNEDVELLRNICKRIMI